MLPGLSIAPSLLPTADELSVATLFGPDPSAPPWPRVTGSIRAAIEDAVLAALKSPPCIVFFSGGRDSSVILAIAVDLARRLGLEEPIAVTNRYPGAPRSLEDDWQASVIRHLQFDRWVRIDRDGEHELLGEAAMKRIRKHGVLLPAMWWALDWPREVAGQEGWQTGSLRGSMLAGLGGDELFLSSIRPIASAILSGRRPPIRRSHTIARDLAPRAVRARTGRTGESFGPWPWLKPEVHRRVVRSMGADLARGPVRYDGVLRVVWADRDFRASAAAAGMVARESGAIMINPMSTPAVFAAAAHRYGRAFPRSRGDALYEVAGDLLPVEMLYRRSKAEFKEAFFGPESRAWVYNWDGSGVDAVRVSGTKARRELLSEEFDARVVPSVQRARLVLDG